MTCRELIEFLWAYHADELPAAQRAVFEAHLGICPSCVAYLESYERSIDLAREAFCQAEDTLPAEVPPELTEAILAARRRPPEPQDG